MKKILLAILVVAVAVAAACATRPPSYETDAPLIAGNEPIELLADLNTETLSPGWVHKKFLTISAADYQAIEENGVPALRCITDNSASILARDALIPVSSHPILSWRWKVVQPISSDVDEATKNGDDHPVRLYLVFTNENKDRHAMEVIWSNKKYAPGDYKIIGDFYHYVANGLDQNVGTWHDQKIDLRKIYKDIGGTGTPIVKTIGFFCDSDNTSSKSEGVFSDIVLSSDL